MSETIYFFVASRILLGLAGGIISLSANPCCSANIPKI